MGILHLAGLGRYPGAVTSGLSYLLHKYSKLPEWGQTVENLVVFTSPEIASGKLESAACELNKYGCDEVSKTWPKNMKHAVEILKRFYEEEVEKGGLWLCELDVNDFSECFKKICQVVLKFHSPGDVGKHIWANITGGTNPLNAAIFQVAFLSGFITKLYYTFISDTREYGKYLQPFTEKRLGKFDFREIFVMKTIFDGKPQQVLQELEEAHEPLATRELWERLGGKSFCEWDPFKRDYLNTMDGWAIKRLGNEKVEIADEGIKYLRIVENPLFEVLAHRKLLPSEKIGELTRDLELKELL